MIEYDVPAGSKSHGTFVVETVSMLIGIFSHDVHNSKEDLRQELAITATLH